MNVAFFVHLKKNTSNEEFKSRFFFQPIESSYFFSSFFDISFSSSKSMEESNYLLSRNPFLFFTNNRMSTLEPIAIVGIGLRLPGADDPEELWTLLEQRRDVTREIPNERFSKEFWCSDTKIKGSSVCLFCRRRIQ